MLDFSVTFIITIINITLLFLILRKLLFKPVTKFMEERTKRVQDSIEQSEKYKAQAKAMLEQYEAQLKEAEAEAKAIIDSAKEQAREEAERIITKSRESADMELARARKQLELEHQAALAAFKDEAVSLVVKTSGHLLNREIKNQDCLSYADMLLKEMSVPNEPGNK